MTRASSYGKFPLLKLFTVGQSADETAGGTVVTACTSPDDALKETYVPTTHRTEPDVREQTNNALTTHPTRPQTRKRTTMKLKRRLLDLCLEAPLLAKVHK